MFATRGNNENAVYEQQRAAAAKPLNQGVKGLAPKTPGNKAPQTPFGRNDENAAFNHGKTGGKGKDGGLFGKGDGGKIERSAFVTPAGPRTARAPLGNKTTNAKATFLQTPGPPPTQEKPSAKPTSPRMRRAKVKIHQAEVDPLENDEKEREIEYMPPRGTPLPDHPDDDCWQHDRTYPQFEGKNLTKGWWSEFQPQKDGSEDELSDFEEKLKKVEEKERKAAEAKKVLADKSTNGGLQTRKPAVKERPPSTLSSRTAASALSSAPKARPTPSFAAPTASAKARHPPALASRKPTGTISAPGNARHTAAKVASNTTLGYAKGRQVSATARKPLSDIYSKPTAGEAVKKASPTKMPFGGGTTLDDLLGLQSLTVNDDADEDLGDFGGKAAPALDEEDDLADFQLEL